jgi:hypothetical protein
MPFDPFDNLTLRLACAERALEFAEENGRPQPRKTKADNPNRFFVEKCFPACVRDPANLCRFDCTRTRRNPSHSESLASE